MATVLAFNKDTGGCRLKRLINSVVKSIYYSYKGSKYSFLNHMRYKCRSRGLDSVDTYTHWPHMYIILKKDTEYVNWCPGVCMAGPSMSEPFPQPGNMLLSKSTYVVLLRFNNCKPTANNYFAYILWSCMNLKQIHCILWIIVVVYIIAGKHFSKSSVLNSSVCYQWKGCSVIRLWKR